MKKIISYLEVHIDSSNTLYLILIDVQFQIPKGTVTFLGHTMSRLQNCKLRSHHLTYSLDNFHTASCSQKCFVNTDILEIEFVIWNLLK